VSAQPKYAYATHLDIKFPALTRVDVPALVKACRDQWYNQTLCKRRRYATTKSRQIAGERSSERHRAQTLRGAESQAALDRTARGAEYQARGR